MLPATTEAAVVVSTPARPVWVTVHLRFPVDGSCEEWMCCRCKARLGKLSQVQPITAFDYEVTGKDGARVIYEQKPAFSNFLSFCEVPEVPEELTKEKLVRMYGRKGRAAV